MGYTISSYDSQKQLWSLEEWHNMKEYELVVWFACM